MKAKTHILNVFPKVNLFIKIMLYPIKRRQKLKNFDELVSLQNQKPEIRLQDKVGEQNYHQDRKKLHEPMTDAIKNTFQDITKTTTETSIKNNKV